MTLISYLSHPIGEGETADDVQRADNIANAGDWVRFFIDTTRWVILCPWYVYAITHGSAIHAPRRLIDQLAALERCDLLVQVGGIISPHMTLEAMSAKRLGIPIVDLTTFGVLPPLPNDDAVQVILARAARALTKSPRRVWMPLLTQPDIDRLREARHALYVHMPDEHDKAVALIDRIIAAAVDRGED